MKHVFVHKLFYPWTFYKDKSEAEEYISSYSS